MSTVTAFPQLRGRSKQRTPWIPLRHLEDAQLKAHGDLTCCAGTYGARGERVETEGRKYVCLVLFVQDCYVSVLNLDKIPDSVTNENGKGQRI